MMAEFDRMGFDKISGLVPEVLFKYFTGLLRVFCSYLNLNDVFLAV